MKKGISLTLAVLMAVMLGACGAIQSPMPENGVAVSVLENPDGSKMIEYAPGEYVDVMNAENIKSCWVWYNDEQEKKWAAIGEMPDSHKSFAVINDKTMDTFMKVLGKGDPCKQGTNRNDAYIAYVRAEVQRQDNLGKNLVSGAKVVVYPVAAAKIAGDFLDAAGDRIGGDKIAGGDYAGKAEGDLEISGNSETISRSEVKNDAKLTQVGTTDSTIEPINQGINPAPEEQEPEAEEESGIPEGFVTPTCSEESREAGRC